MRNRHERQLIAEPLTGGDGALPLKSMLPGKPPELNWRDYLVMLLHVGAEVEHALMVEYLYAAYSLGGSQVSSPGSRDIVLDWRTSILTVAKEEMGHLLTVQNLLCLLGGPPSFEREDYPWSSPFYPFPFCLEKLSLDSLACYVYAEEERDLPEELGQEPMWQQFEARDRKLIEQIVTDRVKDAGWDEPHHVGEIYDSILEILEDPTLVPDSCFDADTYALQASWDEWGQGYRPSVDDEDVKIASSRPNVIVAQMANRTEAIAGVKAIAGQGEAPHLRDAPKKSPSHFDRFVEIFQKFDAVKDPTLVRPVPTNPSTRPPGPSGEGTYIASDTSRAVGEPLQRALPAAPRLPRAHVPALAGSTGREAHVGRCSSASSGRCSTSRRSPRSSSGCRSTTRVRPSGRAPLSRCPTRRCCRPTRSTAGGSTATCSSPR